MPSKRLFYLTATLSLEIIILFTILTPEQSWLDSVSQSVTILTALTVIFGIFKYYDDKNNSLVLTVIDQLSFFRNDVLTKYVKAQKSIISYMGANYKPGTNRVGVIDKFDYAWAYPKFKKEFIEQAKYSKNELANEEITDTLNALEQFSWSIILNKNIEHSSLAVMHDTFCEIVEIFAHQILFLRLDKPKLFDGIRQIYAIWASRCDRRSEDQKIEEAVARAKGYKV